MDRTRALTARAGGRPAGLPILACLAAAALLLGLALWRVPLRSDMAGFLPEGRTEAARLLLRELREGAATAVILVGIEGAPAPELARLARATAATLSEDPRFAFVGGGDAPAAANALLEGLFARRYLLSSLVRPDLFTEASLGAGLAGLLSDLRSSAAPIALRYGLADPVGAFPALLRGWGAAGGDGPRVAHGAWFAPGRDPGQDRALLLLRTRAGGVDIAAQERATAAIDAAFAAARPSPGARLLVAGPAVFARDAARAIQGDVERIALISTPLLAALLLWRFRSALMLAVVAVPVVLGIAAAVAVVGAVWGAVHGAALGFGITMLGVAVDYPVLLVGHRKPAEAPAATLARIAPAFLPAVATAALGLGGMAFAGFPGLAQLGAFAAVGLLAAAAATWWLLPRLIAGAELAPAATGRAAPLLRLERLRRHRVWAGPPLAGVALWLAWAGGPRWEGELAALSPVPEASRALDAELRGALGAPEPGWLLVVEGADAEAVLTRQETLLPALEALGTAGAIAGFEAGARLLPSRAEQERRRAALPDRATLAAALDAARAGTPFRAEAFRPFQEAVEATRAGLPALTLADLEGAAAARLAPLLGARDDGGWSGTIAFVGVRDPAALAALALPAGATLVDLRAETDAIVAHHAGRAFRWLGWGALAALLALAAGLRDAGRVARVVLAVGAALLLTVAALTAAGVRLSLLHIVSLQLVAGIGLDYALFFARPQLDLEERLRTWRTLLTCIAATLLGFGLLAFSATPFLRDIGATVALGAVLMLGCGFLFAGSRPRAGDGGPEHLLP